MKPVRNIPASVRQRLLDRARSDGRPFAELLQYYAMERFLYRLSRSAHADQFILKGALMLTVWHAPDTRPTMDIDMLGMTRNEESAIAAQILEIMAVEVPPDGLAFNPATIRTERITEDADYRGIRVRFDGTLDKARVSMQIDIGFGDILHPGPEKLEFPVILDFPSPKLFGYTRESVIAEKFEAMIKLGVLNSRMKDFYDIWLLSRRFAFDEITLAEAIRLTFRHRGTMIPEKVGAFTPAFIESKQVQWATFRRRLQGRNVPESFKEIVSEVEDFLLPFTSPRSKYPHNPIRWPASGPWVSGHEL